MLATMHMNRSVKVMAVVLLVATLAMAIVAGHPMELFGGDSASAPVGGLDDGMLLAEDDDFTKAEALALVGICINLIGIAMCRLS